MKKLVAIVALAAAPVLFAQEKKLSNATKSEVSKVEQEKMKADADRKAEINNVRTLKNEKASVEERRAEVEKMKKAATERRAKIKKENKSNQGTKAKLQSKSVK